MGNPSPHSVEQLRRWSEELRERSKARIETDATLSKIIRRLRRISYRLRLRQQKFEKEHPPIR